MLLRTFKCVHGAVDVVVECEPMFDYGARARTLVLRRLGLPPCHRPRRGAIHRTLRLETSLRLGFEGGRAAARTRLRQSERAFVALCWSDGVAPSSVDEAFAAVEATSNHWRRWVGGGSFPDHPWRAHLHRSALTLKALTHAPTGAVVASPTTSLPRVPGGRRNWDLRYSFVRESAWALRALYALGFAWEADDFLSFLVETTSSATVLSRTSFA